MPQYHYKTISRNGDIREGNLRADTRSAAIEKIQASGDLLISAEEFSRSGSSLSTQNWPALLHTRISRKDVLLFTRELATLLNAGLPLDQCLQTIASFDLPQAVRDLVLEISSSIQAGQNLSEAMAEHDEEFDSLYLSMIRAGEASGALDVVIGRLAEYLDSMDKLRSTVITALIYPTILLLVSLVSIVVLMTFVVPQFIPLFEDVGSVLPLVTRMVFSSSVIFQKFWLLGTLLVVLAFFLTRALLKDKSRRLMVDNWRLRLPVLGELTREIEIARFSRTLATTLANGVPLLTGIRLVQEVVQNTVIAGSFEEVIASLEQGGTISSVLKNSNTCPGLAVRLIEIGEETGELGNMLFKIADIYDQQSQTSIKRGLSLFEPALILLLGGLIAIIITSILLAILGMNDLVI